MLLAYGVQGRASEIPWSDVNSAWTVALWGPTSQSPQDLFVVDPEGGRYLAASGLPSGDTIIGWSGDEQRVLLGSGSSSDMGETISDVDISTGSVLHQFATTSQTIAVGYTQPNGFALLQLDGPTTSNGQMHLHRTDLSGNIEVRYPTSFSKVGVFAGGAMETPDGTEIMMGATSGLALVTNDGTVVSQIPVPGATGCRPVRWLAEGVALVECSMPGQQQGLYWTVPLSGSAKELPSTDNSAIDIWQLPDGATYGQEAACGTLYISKLDSQNPPRLGIPGTPVTASDVVVGAVGDDLELNVMYSCAMAPHSHLTGGLILFNPATGSVQTLLGGAINGGFITQAVQYGETDTVGGPIF